MRSFTATIGLFLFLLVIVSCQAFAGEDLGKLQQRIEELSDKMVRAYIEEDWETALSFYTDDVVSMPNYGEMLEGKDAVIEREKEMRETGVKVHSLDFTTLDLWVCGDMVYEIEKYGISLTLPGMAQPVADNGKYLTIWEKQSDGSLKIKIEIWNTDMNPMAMAEEYKEKE